MHFKNLGRTLVKIGRRLIRLGPFWVALETRLSSLSLVSVKFDVGICILEISKLVRVDETNSRRLSM